jgi:porin
LHITLSHNDQYFLLATYDGIAGDPAHPRGTHVVLKKSDGLLTAAEWGFAHEKSYKIAFGGWQHTAEVENPVDGTMSDSNSGYYLLGEKYFTEDLAVFFQYGHADNAKNQIETYSGLGITYSNFLTDKDALGLGYAQAKNGSAFLRENPDLLSAEAIVELTYYRPLTEQISVQTSLYYIEHPSMAPDVDNSVALGLRVYWEF